VEGDLMPSGKSRGGICHKYKEIHHIGGTTMARKLYQIRNIYPHLKNPGKYASSDKLITCRSGWEITFVIKFLDVHPSVLQWTSESTVIPYLYPIDGRMHRYFVDYWMKSLCSDGSVKEYLIEIKPYQETLKPPVPKRQTKGYLERVHTYIKNMSKWDAARRYCTEQQRLGKQIEFMVITERDGFFI
jgi:hypothetical protein